MSDVTKVPVSKLPNVSDPGFTPYALSCVPSVGIAKTGKPYYFLKFTLSRGGYSLSYDIFMKDNDISALAMFGVIFPELPAPVQVSGSAIVTT